jgi:LysM repeat protein
MSIELIKDILRIEELRGKEDTQALVETEIYLNPSRPDLESILWADGVVEVLSTKVIRDRLVVSGVVKFKVVYKSKEEEKSIYTIDSNADFREEIGIEGITEDMSATIKTNIEYIEHELLDERKLSLKALVSLEGKVEEVKNIEIIKDIERKESLQTLKETIKYKEIYGRETAYAFVKEAFELREDKPAIEEILKLSIQAYEEDATVADDRIIISGMVNARVVYYGEGQIATIEEEMPFNHFLEIPGALSGSQGEILMEVVEGGYEVLEDDEGELKVLDIEAKISISGLAYSENEKNLIVDAYSTKEKIKIEKEELTLVENIKNVVHKESIVKDLSQYKIREIYDLTGYPSIIESRFIDGEFIVEGICIVQGIYLDDVTESIDTLREEIPYKYYLSLDEKVVDPLAEISLDLETIRANLSKDIFVVEASVKHNIKINRNRSLSLIKSLEETGEIIDKRNRPSITIYIVQREDKLWDIAKRYNTTVEEILQANDSISPSDIVVGEKIIIEKTVDISF